MTRAITARRLRRRAGYAEGQVWRILRAGRIDGLKFRRQHPVGPYVADFACPTLRLIIEVDGEVHQLPSVAQRDRERTIALEALGWTVVRVSNEIAITRTTEIIEAVRRHAAKIKS